MSRTHGAFTLLETMVALTIFIVLIVGCVKAIAAIGGTVAGLRLEGEVRRSLENHVAELRAQRPFPRPGVPSASTVTNGIGIRDEVTQIEDAAAKIKPEDKLYQVRLIASWKEGNRPQSLTNTIYLRGTP